MKRLFCMVIVILICAFGLSACTHNYITNIDGSLYEFTADRDYGFCEVYVYLVDDKENAHEVSRERLSFDFVSSSGYAQTSVYKGDKMRMHLELFMLDTEGKGSYLYVTTEQLHKIKIVSRGNPEIYYEQVFNG